MIIDPQDHLIRPFLRSAKVIAVVGLSPKENRPSHQVARYLQQAGYRIVPVNPGQDRILGEPCYSELAAIPEPVDIVDVFRRAEEVLPIAQQAIAIGAKVLWLQQGIINENAARLVEAAGMTCIMDRCIKVDHQRLLS
ncbi:CoA-binding protein [Desulfofustis limnaeus]|uniref:CoA-binding protein n=1 Tax=Desulfofustis limnaeus TaxID=2740163 RepID=A0ABM7WCB8_9BACT|nr:CoA-binding protein [Desulfofustis limnaeus]BDD88583.1 CoA-binding protein [Desulfofustis limnaeus]